MFYNSYHSVQAIRSVINLVCDTTPLLSTVTSNFLFVKDFPPNPSIYHIMADNSDRTEHVETRDAARERIAAALGNFSHVVELSYGTAGFRSNSSNLHQAMIRCGMIACCRSHALDGKAVGAMITASHNPEYDNGIKLVEPDGSMFSAEWEPIATSFVNATIDPLSKLEAVVDIAEVATLKCAAVVLGRDTRDSSLVLADLFAEGVNAFGGLIVNTGIVTTPQLHLAVRSWNEEGDCMLNSYKTELSQALRQLVGDGGITPALINNLVIDCANGVGASAVTSIKNVLSSASIINTPGDGPLNADCGADFVQKKRIMPTVYGPPCIGRLWASLDGDADRLVMYREEDVSDDSKAIILADGDRFASLVTKFITTHLALAKVTDLSVAVAQTAYSNGAATEFLRALDGVEVVIAKTGVKHLEKAVADHDIGIYWEPNGHGTVLFKKEAVSKLKDAYVQMESDKSQTEVLKSLNALLCLTKLANQAVGDGVSNLLLIMGILTFEKISFDDWLSLYDERCSCNMVVRVADRAVITTTDCDRKVGKPATLKEAIEKLVSGEGCRAFVRPSGTEDVVRVYAEAPVGLDGKAREMAVEISRAVFDHCGGVGERP